MKNKFCREILSLTFLAVLFMQAPAQQKALQIGDKIPEEIWTTALSMGYGSEKTTTLAKDRGKLILLDFWATWCSACLLSFPKMEALRGTAGIAGLFRLAEYTRNWENNTEYHSSNTKMLTTIELEINTTMKIMKMMFNKKE